MSRFFPLLFVVLALISSHVAFGAPSYSQGMKQVDACISKCKNKFGWPGFSMGNDHWASVVQPSNEDACGGHKATVTSSTHHHSKTPSVPKVSPASSPSPSPTPTSTTLPSTHALSSASNSSDNVSSDDISAYLSAHNTVRTQHGADPLTWSDDLSAKAQQWADGCVFKHSGGSLGPFGENLAAGTGSFTIADAVGLWNAEVSQYDSNNPVPSHFTQVVWKSTTQVGCAVQSCSGIFDASYGPAQYYVCEYSPAGNVIGEFAQNVQV
jgi:uncharacterized protein YkwD